MSILVNKRVIIIIAKTAFKMFFLDANKLCFDTITFVKRVVERNRDKENVRANNFNIFHS